MKKTKKGFTLIELLVVIAIIGLLSTLSVVALNNARAKSRDARRVSDIKQMQTALELFYNDSNGYPLTATLTFVGGANDRIATGTKVYMAVTPRNPRPWNDGSSCGSATDYTYTANGAANAGVYSSYTLTYCLGDTTGGIPAGARRATPAGLNN